MPVEEHKKTLPTWVGFLVLAVLIGAVGSYYWYSTTGAPVATETPATVLMQANPSYAEAIALHGQFKFAEARAKYEEALRFASSEEEQAQIRLKIAHTVRDEGDLVRAAQLYKEVAGMTSYPAIARAYAVQSLALLYDYAGDPAVRTETFKGEPYVSFYVQQNFTRSYKNLFEYAAQLYPLAIPELRSAAWYANALLRQSKGLAQLSEEDVAEYQSIVAAKLQRADADIARTQDDPNEAILRPEISRARAIVLGRMALAGYGSLTEAEAAYDVALHENEARGGTRDGFMRYWYAAFLSEIEGRDADVVAMLAPLYTDSAYASSLVTSFFTTERNNQLRAKETLQRLAGIDPQFKQHLISLGWTDADFE